MANTAARGFVRVQAPTVHAGVGNALRQAYAMDGDLCSLTVFEDLVAKLDRGRD